jgi:AcrR family transcriptional regulator
MEEVDMPRVNVKDKRKQQLIDANMASIAKRGLADTTIAHVSDGASMSRGIVNFYFTSKEKMMQETLAFLISEQNACWQDALADAETPDPVSKIEAVMRALMGDKLCSARRLAVLSAFIGHAGTHAGYAKLIRLADEMFIKQIKTLWQQAGIEAKKSELRSRQMLTLIRGHHVMAFLNADWGKPSSFSDHWKEMLSAWAGNAILPPKEKSVKIEMHSTPVIPPKTKPKKPATMGMLPGQLDFGDLFAKK